MTEEAVAEAPDQETSEPQEMQLEESQQEPRMVPLEAMEAERRKRQDQEAEARYLRQRIEQYEAQRAAPQQTQEEEYDDPYTRDLIKTMESRVERRLRAQQEEATKRSVPNLEERLENELKPLLQRKPWLAQSIANAPNRYERALEILDDYAPRAAPQREAVMQRMEENRNKPGSPNVGPKSSNLGQLESLKRMNRREFSQWRAEMRGTVPNIR